MSAQRQSGWNELRLHDWLARRPRPAQLHGSAQHDAAVLHHLQGRPAICCDQVVLGVHAEEDVDPFLFGAKVVLRTLSDLAATAAQPLAVTLAGRFDRGRSEGWIRSVIEGASAAAVRHGAGLVAGDLSAGPGAPSLTATALGEVFGEGPPPGRDRARPGQLLLCTGPLGGSRGGRHLAIQPRLDEGRVLAELGATALIDVSDGLLLDAERIGRASGVAVVIEEVPVHADALEAANGNAERARSSALRDGEDHELLATLDEPAAAEFLRLAARVAEPEQRALHRSYPDARLIGRIEECGLIKAPGELKPGVWLHLDPERPPRRPTGLGGYVHGGGPP